MKQPGKKARAEIAAIAGKAQHVTALELSTMKLLQSEADKLGLQAEMNRRERVAHTERLTARYGKFHGVNTQTGEIVREAPEAPKP